MLNKRALLVVVFCSLAFSVCPLLYGQATGSFSGTVSDKAGAVVSGATVKATSQGTGVVREAKTDDSGHYLIPLLPIAFYTIRVDSQGFQATEQKDIRLQVDEHREVDFALAPASVSSTVEVNATEVAVENYKPLAWSGNHIRAGRRSPFERTRLCTVGDADTGRNSGNQPQQLFQRRRHQ